jgi:soluble lytic murein transglycosylase-like protein
LSPSLPAVPPDIAPHIITAANRHAIPVHLFAALVFKESSFNPLAIRYEPAYRWLWDTPGRKPIRRLTREEYTSDAPPADFRGPEGVSPDYEWMAQRTSWGLCQVMGAVARERGFDGDDFSALLDPDRNLELGGRLLSRLLRRYDVADALSAYNAGSPTQANERTYVVPIMRWAAGYKAVGI